MTELAPFGTKLIFSADDGITGQEPWLSDGTLEGTQLIKDIGGSLNGSNTNQFTSLGSVTVFVATSVSNGRELWRTDGTPAGTVLLKDINPGTNSSFPDELTTFNGNVFFVANNGVNGFELWKTDGTAAGTTLVRDITAGTDGTPIRELTATTTNLFFLASTQLWKTDGSQAGTVLVKAFNPDYFGAEAPRSLTAVGGTLFLAADDGSASGAGQELWKSDGTGAGTVLVKDISPGLLNWSQPRNLVNFNGILYFQARDDSSGQGTELWRSDGNIAGTFLVKDINTSGASFPNSFEVVGSTLFFVADNGVNGDELWKTDGTEAGTILVKDVFAGSGSSSPLALTAAGNRLFFSAVDQANGRELWVSNGLSQGTNLVADINPGSVGSNVQMIAALNQNLIAFGASDGASGTELRKSDGTAAGTSLVQDLTPGANGSNPSDFHVSGNKLFFVADNGVIGREPYVANLGVPAGNVTSIFTTQTPSLTNVPAEVGYELGTKFSSTQPGRITQIRYWKALGETGTHTERVWTTGGLVLATVTFVNESASGWQTATLSSALEIMPNTTYVVTVNANLFYVSTSGLASQVSNQPLQTEAKKYGVFGSLNGFPTVTYRNRNYFRDVVFQSLP